ncbi:MAG: spermidine/putrescine ABC transporter substrate-binding protein [Clostridia bacterium]|nr:spermidine/putrescine ABC transporter substrate-binding protein [Clostridia bacterium]
MNKNKVLTIIAAIVLLIIIALIVVVKTNNTSKKNPSISMNRGTTTVTTKEEKINYVGEISVYNAAEYMDASTIKDFEKEYKIKVNYKEFESNEAMYDDFVKNPNKYDVLVPSDYMIDRLIKENRLEKINKQHVTNLSNIASEYLNPEYDKENDYVVPYMTGTLGILYNKKLVNEEVTSWSILWNSKYKGQIWMWDSMRDAIGMALKSLGYSMNSSNDEELNKAKQTLISQNKLLKGYAEEESRDAMIADEGALALVYSGEAKFAVDQNPNLAYVIPEEGSNKFVDGFVIVKGTKNKEAAENFINFMCRSNIAIRNMTTTGYTSPIKGAWSEFGNNRIMFPSEQELARCEAFLYDATATQKYTKMWNEVK